MTEFLRLVLRKILGNLSKIAIKKHKPDIIVIVGDFYPTLVRETIYNVISLEYNARRNIERSEREFSIPLTILGILYYPNNFFNWVYVLIKASIQLLYLKSYKHTLILQMGYINNEIFQNWYSIVNPNITVILGNVSTVTNNYIQSSNSIIITLTNTEIERLIEGKYTNGIEKIADIYNINESEARKSLSNNHAPRGRINFILGKNNSFLIDSRHYYHPPNINSVLEIADSMTGNKYVYTSLKKDRNSIPKNYTILTRPVTNPDKNGVYIFRGKKNEFTEEVGVLSLSGTEL